MSDPSLSFHVQAPAVSPGGARPERRADFQGGGGAPPGGGCRLEDIRDLACSIIRVLNRTARRSDRGPACCPTKSC